MGVNIGQTDISRHLSSSSKWRVSDCRVTWLIRGRCDIGAIGNLMVRSIIWVQVSNWLLFISVLWEMVVGLLQCITKMRR